MSHAELIDKIVTEAKQLGDLQGFYLSGSFGNRTADQYSDLDFVAVADPANFASVAAEWEAVCRKLFDGVFFRSQIGKSALINVTTSEWIRIDLFIEDAAAFLKRAQNQLACLFEHEPFFVNLTLVEEPAAVLDERLIYMANEFLRILGLATVGLGRGELFLCTIGLGHLRNLFMNFAVEVEKGKAGGALHLSKTISAETLVILNELPAVETDREQIIFAHVETAQAFLAYAKPIFSNRELVWPQSFEDATRVHLVRELGERAQI